MQISSPKNLNVYLAPMREKRAELQNQPNKLDQILSEGSGHAQKVVKIAGHLPGRKHPPRYLEARLRKSLQLAGQKTLLITIAAYIIEPILI